MAEYFEALGAILAIDIQQTPPAHRYTGDSTQPVKQEERTDVACTARERVESYIHETDGSYPGRDHSDIYITVPLLADILDCSRETARRRLEYFEEQGVVYSTSSGRRKHYELHPDYTGRNDELIRAESKISDVTKRLLDAAKEE